MARVFKENGEKAFAQREDTAAEMGRQKGITVRVIGYQNGLETYTAVQGIRIHSKDYTLLIMLDHTPLLGKVQGNIEIITAEDIIPYTNIRGYYKHQHNAFTLLLDKAEGGAK